MNLFLINTLTHCFIRVLYAFLTADHYPLPPIGKCGTMSIWALCQFFLLLVTYPLFSLGSSDEEVVDLTCEGSEPAVVDLTNNDSVVVSLLLSFTLLQQ